MAVSPPTAALSGSLFFLSFASICLRQKKEKEKRNQRTQEDCVLNLKLANEMGNRCHL